MSVTTTMNGTASRCSCLNQYDTCAHCRAELETARANPQPPAAPVKPAPKPPRRKARQSDDVIPPAADAERWLTAAQAARMLAIGVRTLWRMTAAGELPQPYRFTRKLVRWDYQSLVRFMRKMREDATRTPPAA